MSDQEQSYGGNSGFGNAGNPSGSQQNQSSGNQGGEQGVKVVHGANVQTFTSLSGRTVGTVRPVLRDVMNVTDQSSALVNGQPVGNDHVLSDNDTLEFVKEAGTKG